MTSAPIVRENSWVGGEAPRVRTNDLALRVPANDNHAEVYQTKTDRRGAFMQTFTGRQVWPLDMRPGDIDIVDIAHSLSLQGRYAGHCIKFYSVAEHSVLVARYLRDHDHDPITVLKGLMHDSTETYLVDVPRPVKAFLAGYKEIESLLWVAITGWLGLTDEMPAAVKEADDRILLDERAQNMTPATYEGGWPVAEPLGVQLRFWSPASAEAAFLDMFAELACGGVG